VFTQWFGAAIAQWERTHGVRLGPRGLQRMMARAGYPVSAGYLSMLCTGHRRHPSRELIEALADVLGTPADDLIRADNRVRPTDDSGSTT
jgi:hypothetical protein